MWFLSSVLDLVPIWVWVLIALIVFFMLERVLGVKGALAGLVALGALFYETKAYNNGRQDAQQKDKERVDKAKTTADKVRKDVGDGFDADPDSVFKPDRWQRD